ncbi:MAG: nicotinamide riboside transporter PnuC [Bacteroidia bacterium]|jgi:nicotinamide mononucleotide transporter
MSKIEILASATALVGVYFTSRKMSAGWMIGAFGSVLYALLFFQGKLYAESVLQLIYAALGFRGWLLWKKDSLHTTDAIKYLNRKSFLLGCLAIVVMTLVIGGLLSKYSDSDVPWLDAFLAASGLTVTVWMMQRYLENWLFWVGIDIASAVLYFSRNMPIAAMVYLIFTILAVYGYLQWKNDLARD